MVLLALKRIRDTLRACVKSSMVPRYVSVAARILCSYASPTVRESECVSGKPYGKTSPTWVVSSAAPLHATGDRALLSGLVTNKHDDTDTFVHAVDEVPMPVVAHGSVVSDEVELPNVCLVPGLRTNLVSICQLVAMDYSVEFGRGMCYIRNSSDGTIVGKAQLRKGGQYVLDFLKVPIGVASSTSLIDMVTDE